MHVLVAHLSIDLEPTVLTPPHRVPGAVARHRRAHRLRRYGRFPAPARVFAVVVITAMSTVMVADERGTHQREAVRDHADTMDAIAKKAAAEPGLANLLPYLDDFATATRSATPPRPTSN